MPTLRPILPLLLCAIGASAAAAPPEPSKPLDQVTVEAHRQALEARVTTFVHKLAGPVREESLNRWNQPMCPLVAGLPQAQGEFMLARISDVARRAAVPLGNEHCHPNLYIVATSDPDDLLKSWKKRDPRLYGDASPVQVRRFLDHGRPIRVWYNANAEPADGGTMTPGSAFTSEYGQNFIPTNRRAKPGGTRIEFYDVMVFASVIVIIDLPRVRGLHYGQLTDYVAMLSLAQPDPDADLGNAPSILQLFSAQQAQPIPEALSDWDLQFLRALYTTDQSLLTQRNQIIQMMMRDLPQ